ncbi:protein phosphatase [Brucella pituitosa]|uniref:protein phosphatase n=1 Tax=Brucella pituitosa TaxID=571256 RepID=UPI0018E1FF31|nr:protein phosphatase [Brucella pituitosa]
MMNIEETPKERAENDDAILVPVHTLTLENGRTCTLYVGNLTGASDPQAMLAENVTSSLNVSLNIHVPEVQLPDGIHVRRAKVGLIDGEGNNVAHMAAAVLALDGLVTQASPGKPYYPAHRAGNVLVNCRGGRSRSVAVLALYLHLKDPSAFPDFEKAVSHIRVLRDNGDHYPLPPMMALADELLATGSLQKLLS